MPTVVDVVGYDTAGTTGSGRFTPLTPGRVLDRVSKFGPGVQVGVQVTAVGARARLRRVAWPSTSPSDHHGARATSPYELRGPAERVDAELRARADRGGT